MMTAFHCHGFAKDVKRLLWFKPIVKCLTTCSYKSSEDYFSLLTTVKPPRLKAVFLLVAASVLALASWMETGLG